MNSRHKKKKKTNRVKTNKMKEKKRNKSNLLNIKNFFFLEMEKKRRAENFTRKNQ